MRNTIAIIVALVAVSVQAEVTTTRADGGSVTTVLSASIAVNRNSTLRREWVAVHDSGLPVDLVGTPGVNTVYERGTGRYDRGQYEYQSAYTLRVREPVAAVEVRFICFDVWGDRTKTLSATDVQDFGVGEHQLDGAWNLFRGENEVAHHYASIAFVAAVRTKAGEIFFADQGEVVNIAKEYMADFTDDLLDVNPPATETE